MLCQKLRNKTVQSIYNRDVALGWNGGLHRHLLRRSEHQDLRSTSKLSPHMEHVEITKWPPGIPIHCHKVMIIGVARVQMIQFGKTSRNILIIHMSILQFSDNQMLMEYTYFDCFEIYEVIKICVCFLVHCIRESIYALVYLSLWMLQM